MVLTDWMLYLGAFICFLIAVHPPPRLAVRWEWLGVALLVATRL